MLHAKNAHDDLVYAALKQDEQARCHGVILTAGKQDDRMQAGTAGRQQQVCLLL